MGWFGEGSWSGWGWWWVFPLICMAVCMMMCMFSGSPARSRPWRCCGPWGRRDGTPDADLQALRKEITELREEIQKQKTK